MLHEIVAKISNELSLSCSDGNAFANCFIDKNASIIAEVKIASPSYNYFLDISVGSLIDFYGKDSHIAAISFLINEEFFAGDISRIKIAQCYGKPSFFKEFIIDKRQIDGAHYYGYDAALLIARLLDDDKLIELVNYCEQKNIFSMIEVDNEEDINRIIPLVSGFPLRGIAINSRNLESMEVDKNNHFLRANQYSDQFKSCKTFAFSGIASKEDAKNYVGLYDGVLIGSSFVKSFLQSKNSINE